MSTPSPGASKPNTSSADEFIQQQLDTRLALIEDTFAPADAVGFSGPIMVGVDDIVRNAIESRKAEGSGHEKLIFLLTTTGGYIEVVQRIVATMRRHYKLVDFVIPNYAYSAGTVLAMSGDAIYMDYYSRLGPIDPQVESRNGQVSALGYLERYEALIKKAAEGKITAAEVQILIQAFDQGELYQYEQARELSIALLKDWLVTYKFKNWTTTRTRKLKVTKKMKTQRAASIARELNKTAKWHSHGHGISKDVLERDLNLEIDDFSTKPDMGKRIKEYHELLTDYMVKTGTNGAIHFSGSY